MADLQVTVDTSGIDRILQEEPMKVENWLTGFAEDMVTNIKNSFGTSPAGVSYRRGGITHIASQSGYPPNVDIGTLYGSIRQEKTAPMERTIYADAEHGEHMENGAEDAGIEPRPFMGPEFADAQGRIGGDARRNLNLDGE